jgi:hypothetical protein
VVDDYDVTVVTPHGTPAVLDDPARSMQQRHKEEVGPTAMSAAGQAVDTGSAAKT